MRAILKVIRFGQWRTLTQVLAVAWLGLLLSALWLHYWTAVFYYSIFFIFTLISGSQEALIKEQNELIEDLRRQNNSLKQWWQ